MNYLLYLLFFSIFFLDYFHSGIGIVPRAVTWIPELLSIITYVIVFMRLSFIKSIKLHRKYAFLIFIQLFIVLIGYLLNDISPKELVIGLRFYFKTLPFFLLPAVYDFSDHQLKKQLLILLPFLMIQFPIVVYQRFVQFKGIPSGDPITGTLEISSILSITLICSMAVVIGFFLKKQIHSKWFFLAIVFFFFPTTLNETKGTYILLPFAFFIPYFLLEKSNRPKIKIFVFLSLVCILFFTAFLSVYDRLADTEKKFTLLEFFSDKEKMISYFYRDTSESKKIRRGDSIIIAFENISKSPLQFVFGYGVGSVQSSFIKSDGSNQPQDDKFKAQMLSITNLLWEMGFSGTIVYTLFLYLLFRDVIDLREQNNITGYFSIGWSAVIVIIFFSLVYKNMLLFNVLNYLFWYFSGFLVSRRFQKI